MMPSYSEYKDSGIEWIGRIPAGWKVRRTSDLFSFDRGLTISKACMTDIGIPCLHYGEIHSHYGFEINLQIHKLPCVDIKYLNTNSQSLVYFGNYVFVGSSEDIEGSGNFTYLNDKTPIFAGSDTIILRTKREIQHRYFAYMFDSAAFREQIRSAVSGVKVFHPTKRIIKNTFCIIPPLAEQEAIAAYLDKKLSEIDTVVSNLQIQAEKLHTYKQQLIAETVTRGLDKTSVYKDSGIEWIGKIPAGWKVVPLKIVAKDNEARNTGMQCTSLLSLSYGNIIEKDINSSFGLIPESFETYQIVNPGYIVLRLTDMQNDKRSLRSGYVTKRGIITSAYTGLIPSDNVNSKYVSYLLYLYDLKKVYYSLGGGLRQSIKYADIKYLPILYPPLAEQEAIAAYLDEKTTLIDTLIADIHRQIEQLKKYRKIIIHDAVTGRVKVPEVQNENY